MCVPKLVCVRAHARVLTRIGLKVCEDDAPGWGLTSRGLGAVVTAAVRWQWE